MLTTACIKPASAADAPGSKPIIGINTDVEGDKPEYSSVEAHYIDAIKKAGGIPVLMPPMAADDLKSLLKHIDGVLMIGGADYPPSLYKQDQHSSCSLMNEHRTEFDMTLVKTILADKSIPFLGICAGCQALNIGSGGSLTQDIPSMKPESNIKHSSPSGWKVGFSKHPVTITSESKLARALGKSELTVVTSHHQCVDKPGDGLKIIAHSPDGVNEAIEKTGERFVVGVQWHPERDFDSNQKLFEELVHQAKLHHDAGAVQVSAKPGK
jgi:putative glutamine amidotransferase